MNPDKTCFTLLLHSPPKKNRSLTGGSLVSCSSGNVTIIVFVLDATPFQSAHTPASRTDPCSPQPHISYRLSSVWGRASQTRPQRVHRSANFAAGLVAGARRSADTTRRPSSLGWPRAEDMVRRRDGLEPCWISHFWHRAGRRDSCTARNALEGDCVSRGGTLETSHSRQQFASPRGASW